MSTNNAINSQDPIQVTKGGTGLNTVAQGDLLIASASNTLASLPKDTNSTRYLSNTGTNNAPAYAQVNLSNGVTGTLPVGNGGTGSTTGAFTSVNFVSITASGTYTPPSNLLFAVVECVGGGGGSAGIAAVPGGANCGVAEAGGGGGYTRKIYAKSALTPNVSVTIGAAGTAGAVGQNNGGNGGNTTFLGMTASGGSGGVAYAIAAQVNGFGTAGGSATGGDINIPGSSTNGFGYGVSPNYFSMGYSGTSPYSSCVKNAAGNGYGGGGSPQYSNPGEAAKAGYAGSAGVVFITEYLA